MTMVKKIMKKKKKTIETKNINNEEIYIIILGNISVINNCNHIKK